MTERRLKKIVLPIFGGFLAVWLILMLALSILSQIYRQRNQAEIENLVGTIAAKYPEVETAEIVKILQDKDSVDYKKLGAEILAKYGVSDGDFATKSASYLVKNVAWITFGGLSVFALVIVSYFWWKDRQLTRKVVDLVFYVQDLSDRAYDLRLEENTEDELSILTNELYKVTVLLKEAAESNQKLAENLETALTDISHQLKTPLTSLQIMIDEIYEDPKMPEKVRQDFLRLMSGQVQSMSGLATTLLNLARLDNGTLEMTARTVRVADLFDQVERALEILAELTGVGLEFQGDTEAKIKLDPRWQVEALTNVVKNAIEHSAPGQKVRISAEDCPLFLKISVQDQGSGMSAKDTRHVFERFYQISSSDEVKLQKNVRYSSAGIGLAFAKAMIEADNGQITVDSKLGKGSTFTIRYFR